MIPELIQSVNVRKGPYFADVGDFGSAGSLTIDYINRLPKNILETTNGTFGYHRGLAAGSTAVGAGTLLAAVEGVKYNGPWDVADNVRKINGVLRYSQGTATDGFTLSAARDRPEHHRPFRDARSDRWRHVEPVLAVGQLGAIERIRADQDQRLYDQFVAAALQQFHLFSRQSH